MALNLSDIMALEYMQEFTLIAGKEGLKRPVSSVGIADYEFADSFVEQTLASSDAFLKDSFVISSLLFAENAPEKIMTAVERLYELGVSGFAYKDVIFRELPGEVLDFADEKGFPIFVFGKNIMFEDVVYRITEAVYIDNMNYFSEENISAMIEGTISPYETELIARGVSLRFKNFISCAYVASSCGSERQGIDKDRVLRNFRMNKKMQSKALISAYGEGIFIIMTADYDTPETFEIILSEILENIFVRTEGLYICRSGIKRAYSGLDRCIRESFFTFEACRIDRRSYESFEDIGINSFIIPLKNNDHLRAFAEPFARLFSEKADAFETAKTFVMNQGDFSAAAENLGCHPNSVRYRLSSMRKALKMEETSDAEFYSRLSIAVRLLIMT